MAHQFRNAHEAVAFDGTNDSPISADLLLNKHISEMLENVSVDNVIERSYIRRALLVDDTSLCIPMSWTA